AAYLYEFLRLNEKSISKIVEALQLGDSKPLHDYPTSKMQFDKIYPPALIARKKYFKFTRSQFQPENE
ncbi:MAG: hypothetical protein ACP5FZ_11335, partial [Fidelibacterota bacterium]